MLVKALTVVCLFVCPYEFNSSRVAEAQTAKPPGRSAALQHCAVLPVRPRNKAPDFRTAWGSSPRGVNLLAVRDVGPYARPAGLEPASFLPLLRCFPLLGVEGSRAAVYIPRGSFLGV